MAIRSYTRPHRIGLENIKKQLQSTIALKYIKEAVSRLPGSFC